MEYEAVAEKYFCVDRAKHARSKCVKCKEKCPTGELRIGKVMGTRSGALSAKKQWFHVECIFANFLEQRVGSRSISHPDDLDGWNLLSEEDRGIIANQIERYRELKMQTGSATKATSKKPRNSSLIITAPTLEDTLCSTFARIQPRVVSENNSNNNTLPVADQKQESTSAQSSQNATNKNLLFRTFRKVIADLAKEKCPDTKSAIIKKYLKNGNEFQDSAINWCRLLLPTIIKRKYCLDDAGINNIFTKIFNIDMLQYLEKGDISDTIMFFFKQNKIFQPLAKSKLLVEEVDDFLEVLSKLKTEGEIIEHFKSILVKSTETDLKVIIRIIRADFRNYIGPKEILDAIHPAAYKAFEESHDLEVVLNKILKPKKKHLMKRSVDELKALSNGKFAIYVDLIVLGAWMGYCKQNMEYSAFLMGCYDNKIDKFLTVTKVHAIQHLEDTKLDFVNVGRNNVPDWLKCSKTMVPDFVARNPKNQPVWEITGAEFTKYEDHTAEGISIRFPRMTKILQNATWNEATNLEDLRLLYCDSQNRVEIIPADPEPPKKRKINEVVVSNEDIPRENRRDSDIVEISLPSSSGPDMYVYDSDSDIIDITIPNIDIKPETSMSDSGFSMYDTGYVSCFEEKIFQDVRLIVTHEIPESSREILYQFFALGGTLEIVEKENATHVLHPSSTIATYIEYPKRLRHITIEWIKNSIAQKELQRTLYYAVSFNKFK